MTSDSHPHRDGQDRVCRIQSEWRRERPELDVSAQGVIGRLHRVALALTTELTRVYRRFDLTEAEFDLLAALRRAGAPYERSASELAAVTMVTSGGLTKRVDRLLERGLVTRSSATGDARKRPVRLTDAGRELIDTAFTAHAENEQRLIDALGASDAAVMEPILTRWLRTLGDD